MELIAVESYVIFYAFTEDIFRLCIVLCKRVKMSNREGFREFKHSINWEQNVRNTVGQDETGTLLCVLQWTACKTNCCTNVKV